MIGTKHAANALSIDNQDQMQMLWFCNIKIKMSRQDYGNYRKS